MAQIFNRGGIDAQQQIVSKLTETHGHFNFTSNKQGQSSADVTISTNDVQVGYIESKSIVGGVKLISIFDKSVRISDDTIFDPMIKQLLNSHGHDVQENLFAKLIELSGGSVGQERPIPEDCLNLIESEGCSHKLHLQRGKYCEYIVRPQDRTRDKHIIYFRSNDGSTRAKMNVTHDVDAKVLKTTSVARPWSSSGAIPNKFGISLAKDVKHSGLEIMIQHFRDCEDNYFVLADKDALYTWIVPGMSDPLGLAKLGAKELSVESINAIGLASYGNAGPGKMRLSLKAKFNLGFSL